jgi:hypothetical protein
MSKGKMRQERKSLQLRSTGKTGRKRNASGPIGFVVGGTGHDVNTGAKDVLATDILAETLDYRLVLDLAARKVSSSNCYGRPPKMAKNQTSQTCAWRLAENGDNALAPARQVPHDTNWKKAA